MLVPSNKQLRYMYFEYLLSDKLSILLEKGEEDWLLDELFSYKIERENVELFAKYLCSTLIKHSRESILDVSDDPHLSLSRFLLKDGIDVSFFGRDDHLKYMSSQFLGIKNYINGDIRNNMLASSTKNRNQLIDNIFFPIQNDRVEGERTTILNYNFFNQTHFHTIIATGESQLIPIIMRKKECHIIAGFCGDSGTVKTQERLKIYNGIVAYLNKSKTSKFYLSEDKSTDYNKEYYVIKRK